MTLKELLLKHPFATLVQDLISVDPEAHDNLYAFREAYYDLLRITPGDPHGEQIVVTTEVELDDDGTEIDRYLHASHCEADPWDECLSKEVVFGTDHTETRVLAQILWHLTFYGFSPEREPFGIPHPRNKFEMQAALLDYRQHCNYARIKCKRRPTADDLRCALSLDEWDTYYARKAHRNRAKRMRDHRQDRRIAVLHHKAKVQLAIDRFFAAGPVDNPIEAAVQPCHIDPARQNLINKLNLESLFDAHQLVEFDLYSRTPTPEGRADFIATNLVAFFRADLSPYTHAEVLLTCDPHYPITADEVHTIRLILDRLLTYYHILPTYHFGPEPVLRPDGSLRPLSPFPHDLHLFLLLSRAIP